MTETTSYVPTYSDVPHVCPKNIQFGSIVGSGNFCAVYNVRISQTKSLLGFQNMFLQKSKFDSVMNAFKYGENNNIIFMNGTKASDSLIRYNKANNASKYYVAKVPHNDDIETYKQCFDSLKVEAKILASLNHENIIKIHGTSKFNTFDYDSNEINQKPYFIILDKLSHTLDKKIENWRCVSSSRKMIKENQSDSDENNGTEFLLRRLDILFDIASALRYLHNKQVIHRDIKPDNIGFDLQGVVKIFDFGLATKLKSESKTQNGLYKLTGGIGTCRYMAPEVAQYKKYNQRTDAYSFSLVMWSVLSLQIPYNSYNCNQWYKNVVIRKERPSLSGDSLSDVVPESVKKLMHCCWQNDIVTRPDFNVIEDELRSISCAW